MLRTETVIELYKNELLMDNFALLKEKLLKSDLYKSQVFEILSIRKLTYVGKEYLFVLLDINDTNENLLFVVIDFWPASRELYYYLHTDTEPVKRVESLFKVKKNFTLENLLEPDLFIKTILDKQEVIMFLHNSGENYKFKFSELEV